MVSSISWKSADGFLTTFHCCVSGSYMYLKCFELNLVDLLFMQLEQTFSLSVFAFELIFFQILAGLPFLLPFCFNTCWHCGAKKTVELLNCTLGFVNSQLSTAPLLLHCSASYLRTNGMNNMSLNRHAVIVPITW